MELLEQIEDEMFFSLRHPVEGFWDQMGNHRGSPNTPAIGCPRDRLQPLHLQKLHRQNQLNADHMDSEYVLGTSIGGNGHRDVWDLTVDAMYEKWTLTGVVAHVFFSGVFVPSTQPRIYLFHVFAAKLELPRRHDERDHYAFSKNESLNE